MLINCPECNKEISDKAETCSNCGYRLPKPEPIINGVYCPSCLYSHIKTSMEICPYCNVRYKDSISGTCEEVDNYTTNHPELKEFPEFNEEAYNKRINYVPSNYYTPHKVTCPYCQSTNTTKISTLSKAGSVALFGIFSQKVKKQWHCNKCGSDF